MRPQQWVKNAFVAAPLFFTPQSINRSSLLAVAAAILGFCALASAVYIINDFADRESDRLHPEKRHRPLAAGTVSLAQAAALLAGLLAIALALSFTLPAAFGRTALIYLGVNLLYSLALKRVSIIDVMLIALCYVLRVEAGAAAITVEPSAWIIVCSGLVALFIALAKRRDDLVRNLAGDHRASLAGYTKPYLDTAIAIVLAALVVSYLIYTIDHGAQPLYMTAPFVIMGVLRYLQIALVEERSGSPTVLVLTDRFLIGCLVGWAATFAMLIYR